MMSVGGLEQGLRAQRLPPQLHALAQSIKAAAALLGAACREVEGSALLRTLLKVSMQSGEQLAAQQEAEPCALVLLLETGVSTAVEVSISCVRFPC